jgi:NADH dehydrogenase
MSPRVVVIGGGFGGLNVTQGLKGAPVEVVLIDRRNHHLFQPLLYQVATAALSPGDIATPIRGILRRQQNAQVWLGEVSAVDRAARRVQLSDGATLDYDYLVVATGASHSYFGHDEWAARAPGLKSLEDALEIRRRVLLAYEAAERAGAAGNAAEAAAWLTFVVIGGGATGVELAGSLAEIARHTLRRDFRAIDSSAAKVILIEGERELLGAYPPDLRASAARQLERIGVALRLGERVTGIDDGGVRLGEHRVDARTVLWAAGVAASPLGRALGAPCDRAGRVEVDELLNVPGDPRVFVIGDLAGKSQDGQPLPGVAQVAIQGGAYVAEVIQRRLEGLPPEPFRYRDKGSMATIGRAAAVAQIGRLHLSGLLAWLAWGLVHIAFLIGFRNRALVMFEWFWQYATWQRGARLITSTLTSTSTPTSTSTSTSTE